MDGLALMFWMAVIGIAALVAAGGVEWALSRPDRQWIRRLRALERARDDWRERVVSEQRFHVEQK